MDFTENTTEPLPTSKSMPVFNNFSVIAEGWYFVCQSQQLKPMQAQGFDICGQQLVFYRGEDNSVRALDAYCPHMGTHLGIGKVIKNSIRCFFHHWQFNELGQCTDIPCQKEKPEKARLNYYRVLEKYGAIWVFPKKSPPRQLADFPNLQNSELLIDFGKSYDRKCHHHVTMINGIDPQHLKTVHNLNIKMELEFSQENDGRQIDISLSGEIPNKTLKEKITRWVLGPVYGYSMRYDHANNGFLTLMQKVRLFGGGIKLPTLHMIFAYRPISAGKSFVQPIYVTPKRPGLLGTLTSRFLIFLTKRAFYSLQGEDGLVYENMRFYPQNLLPIDRPVAQYIQFVNKLPISSWKL